MCGCLPPPWQWVRGLYGVSRYFQMAGATSSQCWGRVEPVLGPRRASAGATSSQCWDHRLGSSGIYHALIIQIPQLAHVQIEWDIDGTDLGRQGHSGDVGRDGNSGMRPKRWRSTQRLLREHIKNCSFQPALTTEKHGYSSLQPLLQRNTVTHHYR